MHFSGHHRETIWVYWGCVADAKGPTPAMVKSLARFIIGCGLVKFRYRSDKEAALKALIEDAIRESGRDGEPFDPNKPQDVQTAIRPETDDTVQHPSPTQLAVPEHSHAGRANLMALLSAACR